MTVPHHVTTALHLPTHVPDILKKAREILTAVTGNAHFPTPSPTLADINAALEALEAAETAAATKAKGTANTRDLALGTLRTLLRQLESYVQHVADGAGDQAEVVIASAAIDVRKVVPRQKQFFHAEQVVSGTIVLFGVVVPNAVAYNWQWSTDGKTWTSGPTTPQAKTTVNGLTPGTTYSFRHEPVLRKGAPSEWSQVITFLVK